MNVGTNNEYNNQQNLLKLSIVIKKKQYNNVLFSGSVGQVRLPQWFRRFVIKLYFDIFEMTFEFRTNPVDGTSQLFNPQPNGLFYLHIRLTECCITNVRNAVRLLAFTNRPLNRRKHIICDRYRHVDKTLRFGETLISFFTMNVLEHTSFSPATREKETDPLCRQRNLVI